MSFELNFDSNYDKWNHNNVYGFEARRPGLDRAAAAVETWLSVSESERAEIHQEVLTTQTKVLRGTSASTCDVS